MVSPYLDRLGNLRDRHLRPELKNTRETAFVVGRKMHDHHERETALGIHVPEELLERRDPSRRRAQPHHRCGFIRITPFSGAVPRVLRRRLSRGRIEL